MQNCSLKNYSLIEQIKQSLPIEEAARHYAGIELKRKGRRLWGLCPFHGEKSPSFMIDAVKGRAQCYGCGWFGDVVDLAQKATGFTVHELAVSLGIMTSNDDIDRRKWQEQKRLQEQARELQEQISLTHVVLCGILKATYLITDSIKAEEGLERPGLATAFDLQAYLPHLLDELESDEPTRQYAALAAAREMIT